MAHRALLARECSDGGYVCYRSRWGGTDRSLGAVCSGTPPLELPVRWEPEREAGEFADVLTGLDYLSTEVVYRERPEETTALLALWFGLPLANATPSSAVGALLGVDSVGEARRRRARFREFKAAVADGLVTGAVPATWVPSLLRAAVAPSSHPNRYVTGLADDGNPSDGAI